MKATRLISLPTVLAALALAGSATAGTPVDSSTLTPQPSSAFTCERDGRNTICRATVLFDDITNEDVGFRCAGDQTLYLTGTDVRESTRRFNSDGLLVRRQVHSTQHYSLSLSPTGDGPTVTEFAHFWWNDVYTTPGDESSDMRTVHGLETQALAPSGGAIFHDAGVHYEFTDPETFHGQWPNYTDPDGTLADVCAALGA